MTYQPKHNGGGRKPLPIDPRVIEALQRTADTGTQACIPLDEADQTRDITALVREIKRAGAHNFPGMSTRVKQPRSKTGRLLFWLAEKNPRLARTRKDAADGDDTRR